MDNSPVVSSSWCVVKSWVNCDGKWILQPYILAGYTEYPWAGCGQGGQNMILGCGGSKLLLRFSLLCIFYNCKFGILQLSCFGFLVEFARVGIPDLEHGCSREILISVSESGFQLNQFCRSFSNYFPQKLQTKTLLKNDNRIIYTFRNILYPLAQFFWSHLRKGGWGGDEEHRRYLIFTIL